MIFSKSELSHIFDQPVNEDVFDICLNSKEAKKGDLFVALKGEKVDAHDFVDQAFANGASLALVDHGSWPNAINVPSSYAGLLSLAEYNIHHTDARYVGVTGSIGKTTTKNFIYHLLSRQSTLHDQVFVTKKNFNSQIGLPVCAATMPRSTKIGVFEMGMSSLGDIRKLIAIVPPKVSVITKICETHLEFFNSVWDIAKSKSEIFETSMPQEAAIIPGDSPYSEFLEDRAKKCGVKHVYKFGKLGTDAFVLSKQYNNDFVDVVAEILGEKVQYSVRGCNEAVVDNSLPSLLAAHCISGTSVKELSNAVNSFVPADRGTVTHVVSRDITIIDDSYNSCPTSLRAAIQMLGKYSEKRKVLVVGDMLELGEDQVHYHENLSATVDKFGINIVFACGPLSKNLFDNLQPCKQGAWCENSKEIAQIVQTNLRDGDCVLVKGSHSMRMDYVVDALKGEYVL